VNPPDAGPGGNTGSIPCGTTTCAIPAQSCCVSQSDNGTAYSCSAADAGCGGGDNSALKCSGAANCPPGQVCCVRTTNNGAASDCQTACNGNQAQLCDPKATPTGCDAGVNCSNNNIGDWGLPPTYATCGGKGAN
jgi:hypothetical protein